MSSSISIKDEQVFSKVTQMFSVVLMCQELKSYKNALSENSQNQDLKKYIQDQIINLMKGLKNLKEKMEAKQLDETKYKELLEKILSQQQQLLQDAEKSKNSNYTQKIQARIQILKKDIIGTVKEKEQWIQKCISISQQALQSPQQQQSQQPQQNNASQQQVDQLAYVIDNKFIDEKVKDFSMRYKQYYNLAVYIKNNVPEKEKARLEKIMAILAEFKDMIVKLKQDPQYPIGKFLVLKAPKITPEYFHQMSQADFFNKVNTLDKSLTQFQKKEMEFKKLTANAKKQPGVSVGVAQQSMERIKKYNQDQQYINNEYRKNPFIHFPEVVLQKQQTREFIVCNPEVPPYNLRLKFIRLVNTKSDKYQIAWSFSVNNKVFSEKTEFSDQSNVLNYTKDLVIEDKKNRCLGLYEKSIEVQLFCKGTLFGTNLCGQSQIVLSDLKSNCTQEGIFEIKNKDKTYTLEYCLQIYEPEFPSQFKVDSLEITKKYPNFDLNEGVVAYVQKHVAEIPQNLIQEAIQKKNQMSLNQQQQQQQLQQEQNNQPENNNNSSNQQQSGSNQKQEEPQQQQQQQQQYPLKYILHTDQDPEVKLLLGIAQNNYPQGITQDMIINIDSLKINESIEYSNQYIKSIETYKSESLLNGGFNRQEKKICRSHEDEYNRILEVVVSGIKSGKISKSKYLQTLQGIIKRDELLAQFYQQYKCQNHYLFIQARKQIVQQEFQNLGGQQQQNQQQQQIPIIKTDLCILDHDPKGQDSSILLDIDEQQQKQFPSYITMPDVFMPENPEKNQSLNYLKNLEDFLQNNHNEDKYAKKFLKSAIKFQASLQERVQEGELSIEDYVAGLDDILKRDEFLVKLYTDKKLKTWVQFVQARRYIISEELREFQEQCEEE